MKRISRTVGDKALDQLDWSKLLLSISIYNSGLRDILPDYGWSTNVIFYRQVSKEKLSYRILIQILTLFLKKIKSDKSPFKFQHMKLSPSISPGISLKYGSWPSGSGIDIHIHYTTDNNGSV